MTTEQFLHFAGHLDWLTPDDILAYLDGLGLWPPATPHAVKVADVTAALLAGDEQDLPLVAGLQRPDGQWIFKCDGACTWADLEALAAFYEAQAQDAMHRASATRDQAVQHGDAHQVLPWEEPPGI